MMIEPITQNDFHLICSKFVGDISPYRIWNKSEMESMISYMLRQWVNVEYVCNGGVFNPQITVEKIGQSIIEMTLIYQHGWGNLPVVLTTTARRKMRNETTTKILMNVVTEKVLRDTLEILKKMK